MLVTVQFPIADMRSFAPGPQRRLSKPAWPDAHPGGEFVRGIGGVDVRRLGGLNGWIGEGTHCRASRLITLDKLPALTLMNAADYPFGHAIQTRLKFRRLYVDGKALAKCEVGFAGGAFRGDWGVQYDFLKILDDILTLECRVPEATSAPLVFSGKAVATRYLLCTTKRSAIHRDGPQTKNASELGLVAAGDPLVFIDLSSQAISLPRGYNAVVMPGNFAFQIFYGIYATGSFRVPIWILLRSIQEDPLDHRARHLRIYLQRIHAEKEVLRLVLNNISSGRLKPDGDPAASDSLQRYLLESTTRISHLEVKADKKGVGGIGALAGTCLEFARPGWLAALTERLDLMNIRPNIRRNIERRARSRDGVINYGVINQITLDQSHHDYRRITHMGDIFSNIQRFHDRELVAGGKCVQQNQIKLRRRNGGNAFEGDGACRPVRQQRGW